MADVAARRPIGRRALLAGGAGFGLALAAGGPSGAQDAGNGRFSSVAVDVGPLRAKGLGPYADRVGAVTGAALRRAFADRLGGRGLRLVVRVDAVSLRAYVGSDSTLFGRGGMTSSDYMEGEALVVDGRGGVVARYPQLSAAPSGSGAPWYVEGTEERQLVALADHFAGWLRRRID